MNYVFKIGSLQKQIKVDGIKREKLRSSSQSHGDIKKQDFIGFWQLNLRTEN